VQQHERARLGAEPQLRRQGAGPDVAAQVRARAAQVVEHRPGGVLVQERRQHAQRARGLGRERRVTVAQQLAQLGQQRHRGPSLPAREPDQIEPRLRAQLPAALPVQLLLQHVDEARAEMLEAAQGVGQLRRLVEVGDRGVDQLLPAVGLRRRRPGRGESGEQRCGEPVHAARIVPPLVPWLLKIDIW
jgi:hypothetical protein